MRMIGVAALLGLSLSVVPALAQDALPEPVRAKLVSQKIAIGPTPMRQIFEVYIGSDLPVFVTSDSILNGYHVLFEESVLRLETARAQGLGDAIAFLYAGADGLADMEIPPAVREAAARRRRTFLATALLLLGREAPDAPPEAAAEAARVEKAEGTSKPAWLGPPDDGFRAIDYGRFKPRGFYTRTPSLERYFRALAWLQAIPFRIERDEEFVAILLLHDLLGGFRDGIDERGLDRAKNALRSYRRLLGPADDVTVLDAVGYWTDDLEKMREHYRHVREDEEVLQDQVAADRERSIRVVGAARTPDGLLLQRTGEVRRPPDGLDVCAMLGSAWARTRLDKSVLAAVDATRADLGGESLYAAYLDCVAALLDEPEPDAPALFKGMPWHVKSCQTVLGGWAQLRHTWTLQAKRIVYSLGMSDNQAGFVEPEPEFFARLGRLARETRDLLEEEGAFDVTHDRRALVALLRATAKLLRETSAEEIDGGRIWRERPDAVLGIQAAEGLAHALGIETEPGDWVALLKVVDDHLPKLEDESQPLAGPLLEAVGGLRFDLKARWGDLEYVCGRLEAIAHKQLRGVALSGAEDDFLGKYGEWLAHVMFYEGNTYSDPRDDAMRVSEVFFDPTRGKRMHVGVGRPHPIWVLYPWQGKEVLCVGGVMAYHEFERDAPLTDAEWKTLLDSPASPPVPAWAASLYAR